MEAAVKRSSGAVQEDRLWQRHAEMAELGGTPKGGVNRQALSAEDAAARTLLMSWAKARNFAVFTDAIGNLFVRRDGADAKAPPVMSGSHMDSQPTGGRFDGMYGVLAAFEALEALEDAGIRTRRPVIAVAWTNEEGSRFQPGAMGSAVFAGVYKLDEMLATKDWKGVVLKDALGETLKAAPAPMRDGNPGFDVGFYVEAHIEQGPRLEAAHKTIGVVTAIQGSRRYIVEIDGEEAHAGTTPRAARKDAYAAATRIAAAMYEATNDADDTLRFTIGHVEVLPGSPNTVPGKVTFTIDMRHPDDAVLEAHEKKLHDIVSRKARPCPARIERVTSVAPTGFDTRVIDLVRAKAQALKLSHMDMPSGAGHDAMHIARLCPAGMIFVPCERGISHNEIENAAPSDLAAGTRVLVEVLQELANR
ncbi:MAG: Zn-dependent hydrolase [Proteobacteria bacterium]|nr:Zn-dependent hydrolase [Pseudomonadota bacterium]